MSTATTRTVHNPAEGIFHDHATRDLVEYAVDLLRNGDVILGDGDQDHAAADMLEALGALHDATGMDLELLHEVRAFAIAVLDGRWTP